MSNENVNRIDEIGLSWRCEILCPPITLLARFTNKIKIEPINEVGAGNEPDLTTSQYFIWIWRP